MEFNAMLPPAENPAHTRATRALSPERHARERRAGGAPLHPPRPDKALLKSAATVAKIAAYLNAKYGEVSFVWSEGQLYNMKEKSCRTSIVRRAWTRCARRASSRKPCPSRRQPTGAALVHGPACRTCPPAALTTTAVRVRRRQEMDADVNILERIVRAQGR